MNKIFNKKVLLSVGVIALVLVSSFLTVTKAQTYSGTTQEEVYAGTRYAGVVSANRSYVPNNILVNSPLTFLGEEYHLQPGQTFDFQVNFSALACTNMQEDVYVYTLPKDTWFNGLSSGQLSDSSSSGAGDILNSTFWENSGIEIYQAHFDPYSPDDGEDYNEVSGSNDYEIDPSAYSALVVTKVSTSETFYASVSASTNIFGSGGHGLSNGDIVTVASQGGTMPIPLLLTVEYTVTNVTENSFKLELAGEEVDIGQPHEFLVRNFSPAAEGGYVAPMTPGTYPFYYYLRNIVSEGYIIGYTLGVIPITVEDPALSNDGVCGTANGGTYTSTDFSGLSDADLCDIGAVTGPTYNGTGWNWGCDVADPYIDAVCSAIEDTTPPPPPGAPDGVCGDAEAYNYTAAAWPPSEGMLCDWGNSANVDVDVTEGLNVDRWDWTCDVADPNNDANCDTGLSNGGPNVPGIINERVNPGVVGEGDQCTIYWTVEDADTGGTCDIYTTTGVEIVTGLPYTVTTDDLEYNVDPKKSYKITCNDGTYTTHSDILTCIEKPTIIEY